MVRSLGWSSTSFREIVLKYHVGVIDLSLRISPKKELIAFDIMPVGTQWDIYGSTLYRLEFYIKMLGYEFFVLTDGITWRFLEYEEYLVEDTPVKDFSELWFINLLEQSPEECAERLLDLHRDRYPEDLDNYTPFTP
ncbi:MAG: hypothetical protein ACFFED_18620 [Candidatus Thorarchaeota archaeon]